MQIGNDVILVMGATGRQGGAVARALVEHGHTVRAMTRKPEGEPARALAALGVEVVQGDFDIAESLERAMRGVWGAFAVQNTWEAGVEREEEQGKRVADVARATGVEHLVYSSVGSAHRLTGIPHFDNKWRVEEHIRGARFPSFVILRPVFFMENFVLPWFKPAIEEGKLTIGIKPDTPLQMIAVRDIGAYGRIAFERHQAVNGRAIDIAGDTLTMPAAAAILSKAAKRRVVFEPTPIEQVRQFSADFATMLEWFDRVGYEADIEGTAREFGVAPTRFRDWGTGQVWS